MTTSKPLAVAALTAALAGPLAGCAAPGGGVVDNLKTAIASIAPTPAASKNGTSITGKPSTIKPSQWTAQTAHKTCASIGLPIPTSQDKAVAHQLNQGKSKPHEACTLGQFWAQEAEKDKKWKTDMKQFQAELDAKFK